MGKTDSEWTWKGSLWELVDIVQWALVFHTVAKNQELDGWKIVSDPELVRDYEEKYGITRRAVVREMLRIAQDGANVFRAIDHAPASEEEGFPASVGEEEEFK